MKLQLIKAANMQKAMAKIHDELGPNALIYRTKQGRAGVEILAGLAGDTDMSTTIESMLSTDANDNVVVDKKESKVYEKLDDLGKCIKELNKKMQVISKPSHHSNIISDQYREYFEDMGFSRKSIDDLFAKQISKLKSTENIHETVQTLLTKVLKINKTDPVDKSKCCAIVGPTGVGKTTTIVKMAVRFIEEYGENKLGIITTDEGDLNINNKLSYYCNLLNIDLEFATNAAEMNLAMSRMKKKKLVLVDTHGVSQRDKETLRSLIRTLDMCKKKMSIFLALPCNQQEAVLEEIVRKFDFHNIAGCILTKLDESINLAHAISISMRYKLPIAYCCNGTNVIKSIFIPDHHIILSLLLSNDVDPVEVSVTPYFSRHHFTLLGRGMY